MEDVLRVKAKKLGKRVFYALVEVNAKSLNHGFNLSGLIKGSWKVSKPFAQQVEEKTKSLLHPSVEVISYKTIKELN